MRKYVYTGETKVYQGHTLHRIVAVVRTNNTRPGRIGGWVESEDNLAQDGDCWVADDVKVFGNAVVSDDACIYEQAEVCGNAVISGKAKVYGAAMVCGNASVYDAAKICGRTQVWGDTQVHGNAKVFGAAKVFDNAEIFGNAEVFSNAEITGNAEIFSTDHYYMICPAPAGFDMICPAPAGFATIFRTKEDKLLVKCGPFLGDVDTFLEKVQKTCGNTKSARVYRLNIEAARLQIEGDVD